MLLPPVHLWSTTQCLLEVLITVLSWMLTFSDLSSHQVAFPLPTRLVSEDTAYTSLNIGETRGIQCETEVGTTRLGGMVGVSL